jgi:hypothetical protein
MCGSDTYEKRTFRVTENALDRPILLKNDAAPQSIPSIAAATLPAGLMLEHGGDRRLFESSLQRSRPCRRKTGS